MGNRKHSLRATRQYRTCPPIRIKNDPEQQKEYEYHLTLCPYCAADMNPDLEHWHDLIQSLRNELAPPSLARNTIPVPGQLRMIRPGLAQWRDGFFYSPPLVLVLKPVKTVSGGLWVAQTCHDDALAGPGDLILTEDQTSGPRVFIETWNCYRVRPEDVGPARGAVSPELLESILKQIENPKDLPEGTWAPRPLVSEDPRKYFRELEAGTAAVFAENWAVEMITDLEKGNQRLDYILPEHAQKTMNSLMPGMRWNTAPETVQQVLAGGRFPEEYYARAAQDEDRPLAWASLIILHGERVDQFKPVQVEIIMKTSRSRIIEFSGRISGIPENVTRSRALCFLARSDGSMISSDKMDWNPVEHRFFARFKSHDPEGRLALAVIARINGE
jgi:hypothetical protein